MADTASLIVYLYKYVISLTGRRSLIDAAIICLDKYAAYLAR